MERHHQKFQHLSQTDSGVSTSSSTDLDQGGYKVISAEDLIQVLSDGFLLTNLFICSVTESYMWLCCLKRPGRIDTSIITYLQRSSVKLPNTVNFLWSSDPASTIPSPDFYLNPQTFDPPLVDVIYNLQVSDSLDVWATHHSLTRLSA